MHKYKKLIPVEEYDMSNNSKLIVHLEEKI